MKKKIHFFQSVNFKIAVAFVLLLLIFVEIIGAYFINSLEKNTTNTFKESINQRVETLASNISIELSRTGLSSEIKDINIRQILSNFSTSGIIECRVIDEKGIVRATSDVNLQNVVGKKNDYQDLNNFSLKAQEAKENGERVWINVQPITSSTGDSVIGALYVKSNIENIYGEVTNTAIIFFTASLIAAIISLVIALVISRAITKPIEELREQAVKISQGDYSGKLLIHGRDELGQLADTFNELSDRIEEAQDTMEAERNRLDSVLSHMTDGVVATDRRGKVIIINEMALNLLGTTSEEAIGISLLELLDIEKEYTLRRLLEEQEEMVLDFSPSNSEQTILKADFSMIRRESGFISGLVCVLHDVTNQEKNERERREFVSNVSHELRTPLTSMRSYLEALNDGAWKNPEIAPNFLRVTQEETDRMIRMINDLLNLSRMDSNASQLQLEYVCLNEMFHFVLDRFDMMVHSEKKNYTIKREFTNREVWVEIDADKIIQVLDNILNNAIKYSPMGGTITCRLLETHNNVIMSISDEGMGIPKKDLGKVFERFYRVDKARSRAMGGSGLGLAISKEVIRAHGGSVWVESDEGKGSTFYISLPYEPYEEELWE